jgi:peptide/nickel transport system substrate-binding protein
MQNNKTLAKVLVVAIAIVVTIAQLASMLVTTLNAQVTLPREKTLYIVSVTTRFGDSFNPFTASAPGVDLVLPPLFAYNFVNYSWTSIIADYYWENDTVLVIKVRPEAKWHDGTSITSDDVIFTFSDAIQTICDVTRRGYWWCGYYTPRTASWIKWEKVDDKTAKLYINATYVRAYKRVPWVFASWIRLAPAHIFRTLDNKTWHTVTFNDPAKGWPIGCGPYKLKYFDPAMVVFERVDDWWGWKYFRDLGVRLGVLKPGESYPTDEYPPKYIVWRAVASADIARAMLISGEADIAGTVVPGLEAYTKAPFNLGAWYDISPWYHPYATQTLYFQHIPPLTIPEVKKAVVLAINREAIASRIVFGFAAPPEDPVGIPPIEVYRQKPYYNKTWITETFKKYYGTLWPINYTYAKQLAREALSNAQINGTKLFEWDATKKRFVWATDITLSIPGCETTFKKGDVLTLTYVAPSVPGTDDAAIIDQIRRDLTDVGIELQVYLSPDSWREFTTLCKGHFHPASFFIVWTLGPAQAAIPGQIGYVDPMYNRTHWFVDIYPCGKAPVGNPGRYGSTKQPYHKLYSDLLYNLSFVRITDEKKNLEIIRQLLDIFLYDPPFIALAHVPIGVTYSAQYWTNWPTAKNPYATPWYDFTARSGYLTYLYLKPVKKPTPTPTTILTTIVVPTTIISAYTMIYTYTTAYTTVVPTTYVTTIAGTPATITTVAPTTITQLQTAIQIQTQTATQIQTQVVTQTVALTQTVAVEVVPSWVYAVIAVLVIIVIAIAILVLLKRR